MGESKPARMTFALPFLLGATFFSLAYGQAPLYYSNQNQYFLHGFALAGQGFLADDWLANTADPTPIFSFLVAATLRLHPWLFHVCYALLMGVYFASLVAIFLFLAGERDTWQQRLVFMTLLLLIHSAVLRWASQRLFGLDYPWYFQAGLAGQYVLGAMFQPSTFGVLLILAIALFLANKPYWAVVCAVLTATIHSTYLLGAGMLTLGFMAALGREAQIRRPLMLGSWALLLVLPMVVSVVMRFRPTSPEAFAEAQRILVHFRIPHHCLPALWCDGIAVCQIAWMVLALVLIRGTRLFVILLVVFTASLLLTLLQGATQSNTLAVLFPWRTSAVLMPIATAIILGRMVLAAPRSLDARAAVIASGSAATALAAGGVAIMAFGQAFQTGVDEVPLMNFVKEHAAKGDVYLIPVQLPNLKSAIRGSLSSDFKPLAAKKTDKQIIPIDLQRFRLYTGAPIFVDFKSIPYRDSDLLEWRQRLDLNQEFYQQIRAGKLPDSAGQLRKHGITHIVVTADMNVPDADNLYADPSYRVYRLGH